jgi:hypothetical protein
MSLAGLCSGIFHSHGGLWIPVRRRSVVVRYPYGGKAQIALQYTEDLHQSAVSGVKSRYLTSTLLLFLARRQQDDVKLP